MAKGEQKADTICVMKDKGVVAVTKGDSNVAQIWQILPGDEPSVMGDALTRAFRSDMYK